MDVTSAAPHSTAPCLSTPPRPSPAAHEGSRWKRDTEVEDDVTSSAVKSLSSRLRVRVTNNHFDGKDYEQRQGVAMGKAFAPAYANIFMAEWEHTLFRTLPNHLHPHLWQALH
jgi:hypothetical protein